MGRGGRSLNEDGADLRSWPRGARRFKAETEALIERVGRLTSAEIAQLAADKQARGPAWDAVAAGWGTVDASGETWGGAWASWAAAWEAVDAAAVAAWEVVKALDARDPEFATASAARSAALALEARAEISEERFETFYGLWARVIEDRDLPAERERRTQAERADVAIVRAQRYRSYQPTTRGDP